MSELLSNIIGVAADVIPQALAAWFGAWAAFRLEAKRQERDERAGNAQDLREALFALISQRNYLINLDEQVLRRHADDPNRFFTMPPLTLRPGYLDIQLGKVTFLLGTEQSSTVSDLELASLRFQTVDGLVQERSRLHLEMQARLEAASPRPREGTIDDIREAAGFALLAQLRDTTANLYAMTAQALIDNRAAYSRLESACSALYPGEKLPTLQELPQTLPTPVG